MPACPASRTSESVIPLQRHRYMGCIPFIAGPGSHATVTIMITVINLTHNTPVLSMCQEGREAGSMGEGGNIYRIEKMGQLYSVCSS